jgi:hypothetical protein
LLIAAVALPDPVSPPPSGGAPSDARATAARILGLTLADVNQRLAGRLPRVLMHESSPEQAERHVHALEQAGFVVVTVDPALVPDDDQRIVARRLEFTPDALVAFDQQGTPHRCPIRSIALFQRGLRRDKTTTKVKVSERHLDVKKALLTGGLLLTKKVERTDLKISETEEAFVLLERNDGAPDVMLYERQLDYRFLGSDMAPSSRTNLDRTWARCKAFAPKAATDERLLQPGFIAGLPRTSTDPVDLALALITLARRRESR